MAGAKGRSGKNPNSLANLKAGTNYGNRGGRNVTKEQRETKQMFLDAIASAEITEKDADGKITRTVTIAQALKERIAKDLLDPDPRFASSRQWFAEMRHGKPNATTEIVMQSGHLMAAVAHSLYEAGVEAETSEEVITILHGYLSGQTG